jgi:hypothetical protein
MPMTPSEASESIAVKFTRVMNATPSPLGPLSDFISASFVSAVIIAIGLFVIRRSADPAALYAVLSAAAVPFAVCAVVSFKLRGTRQEVVAWLTTLPFPVDNLNSLLAGLGDTVELVFTPGTAMPARADLQPRLETVSDDILLVKERPDERTVEIRLGVIDSKRLPLHSNHQRWKRFCEVTEKVLAPLAQQSPIERMRIV